MNKCWLCKIFWQILQWKKVESKKKTMAIQMECTLIANVRCLSYLRADRFISGRIEEAKNTLVYGNERQNVKWTIAIKWWNSEKRLRLKIAMNKAIQSREASVSRSEFWWKAEKHVFLKDGWTIAIGSSIWYAPMSVLLNIHCSCGACSPHNSNVNWTQAPHEYFQSLQLANRTSNSSGYYLRFFFAH